MIYVVFVKWKSLRENERINKNEVKKSECCFCNKKQIKSESELRRINGKVKGIKNEEKGKKRKRKLHLVFETRNK